MTTTFPQQSAARAAYATPGDIEAGRVTGVGYAVSVDSGQAIPVSLRHLRTCWSEALA